MHVKKHGNYLDLLGEVPLVALLPIPIELLLPLLLGAMPGISWPNGNREIFGDTGRRWATITTLHR